MGLKMLLHVVGTGELLLAAGVGALDSLLGSVNLGVARGMARGCEGLLTAMSLAVAAGIPLSGSLHGAGGGGADIVVDVRGRAADVRVDRTLHVRCLLVVLSESVEGCAREGIVDGGGHG
jgi:hypothetical protein